MGVVLGHLLRLVLGVLVEVQALLLAKEKKNGYTRITAQA